VARERSLRIRPFDDVYDRIWTTLSQTTLLLGETPYARGRHNVNDAQLAAVGTDGATIIIDFDVAELEDDLRSENVTLEDLRLSVYVSSQFMNLGHLAYNEPIRSGLETPIRVPLLMASSPATDPLHAAQTGFRVRALITLDRPRPTDPDSLTPSKRHSILSEADFWVLSLGQQADGLEIHRLNANVRQVENVPGNTLIYIKPLEDSPLDCRTLDEAMTIFLDDRIMSKIEVAPNHVESRLQMSLIKQAILTHVAQRSVADIVRLKNEGQATSFDDVKSTLLGGVLKSVEKQGQALTGPRASAESLFKEMMDQPHQFAARIQAVAALRTRADETFEGNED
jgi:hypothetical protein